MRANSFARRVVVAALALNCALAISATVALSIESEPVKVTHRNSGPRYNIEEVERTKLSTGETESPSSSPANEVLQQPPSVSSKPVDEPNNGAPPQAGQDEPTIGHVSIRRIFLVPTMMRPDWQAEGADGERETGAQRPPLMLSDLFGGLRGGANEPNEEQNEHSAPRPFWPFLAPPARRPQPERHHHLFGADEASRSPSERVAVASPAGGERENMPSPPMRGPDFDPIQMMVELMRQAISGQLAPPSPPATDDLNKEAATNNKADKPETGLMGPQGARPMNETKEDIVEIEGKKFLRKTIINRHIGENIVFMTKRLIFVPLNETDSSTTSTEPTTTSASATSVAADSEQAQPTTTVKPETRANEEQTSSPTTTITSTTTTNAPTTTTAEVVDQSSTAMPSETTTGQPTSSGTTAEEATTTTAATANSDKPANVGSSEEREKAIEKQLENAAFGTTA